MPRSITFVTGGLITDTSVFAYVVWEPSLRQPSEQAPSLSATAVSLHCMVHGKMAMPGDINASRRWAHQGPCHMQMLTVLLQYPPQEDRGGPQSRPGPSWQGHTEQCCWLHFQKQCISVGRTCPRLINTLPIASLAPCHPDMTRLLWVLGAARAATACCSSHKPGLPGGSPERCLSEAHKMLHQVSSSVHTPETYNVWSDPPFAAEDVSLTNRPWKGSACARKQVRKEWRKK